VTATAVAPAPPAPARPDAPPPIRGWRAWSLALGVEGGLSARVPLRHLRALEQTQALRPAADGPRKVAVQASDEAGRIVARLDVDFAATATKGESVLPTPPELRNRMARLDIETQGGAGSTVLLESIEFQSVASNPLQTPLWQPQVLWLVGLVLFALISLAYALHSLLLLVRGDPKLNRYYGPASVQDELEAELTAQAERAAQEEEQQGKKP
jgi:hypothetical protein